VASMSDAAVPPPDDVRTRIVAAAARLIEEGGPDAATTRAVAAAASVQAPTIYRLFGDKRGLLDAVAEHGLARYVASKAARPSHPDPVQDFRDGWNDHVAFGLAHPGLFAIMVGDAQPHLPSPAAAAGIQVLQRRIRNLARVGRLRMTEERALALTHSVGVGTVLTLLRQPEAQRDVGLATTALDAVLAAITGEADRRTDSRASAAAVALRASLGATEVLSPGERALLDELLERLANAEG